MSNSTTQKKRLTHVAELAGVSLSTVDRVLNERGSVSDAKRRKVLDAARTLGINRLLPSPVHGLLRFDLLMVESTTDHYRRVAETFSQQATLYRSRMVLQRKVWREGNPDELVNLINNPTTARQGLIVVAHDQPAVRAALTAQVAKGVPVVLLTSSLSELSGAIYVGIDNHAAGRIAGRMLTQWAPAPAGRVLLITNSLLYNAHQERVSGFLSVLQERASKLVVIGPVACHDDDRKAAHAVRDALDGGQSLAAIYNTGSGSAGIRQALLEHDAHPVWLTHEASEQHARFLREGLLSMVLDQDAIGQAEATIQHLLHANGDLEAPTRIAPQLRIVIDESLDC